MKINHQLKLIGRNLSQMKLTMIQYQDVIEQLNQL